MPPSRTAARPLTSSTRLMPISSAAVSMASHSWITFGMGGDVLRSAGAALRGRPLVVILKGDKCRGDVAPAPAGAAQTGPAVVVLRRAAHVDHAIDRTGAAQCPPPVPALGRLITA